MQQVETEIIASIQGQLNHVVERIEHELGANVHFTRAQTHAMNAVNEMAAYLREKAKAAA